jgi:hypothetical protein
MGIKKLAKKIYMKLYEISSYSHSQEYSRVKSGLHVCVILNDVNLENGRDKVVFVHDKASAYNAFN